MTDVLTGDDKQSGRIGQGRLVLVVGPSGAGKDTLIGLAQQACADDESIVFARRVVTREASAYENNLHVSEESFCRARDAGAFAAHWQAHGLFYGLPVEVDDDIRAGRTIVVNVSRAVVAAMRAAYQNVLVVLVTAPPRVLAERLAGRARASDGRIADRLGRAAVGTPAVADLVIENIGPADKHARALIAAIRRR